MSQQISTLTHLMAALLKQPGMVVLRNEGGTIELKGQDLTFKEHGDWITVYHGTEKNSENRSHLHLRKNVYTYATIRETQGYTPQMTFWPTKSDVTDDKPPFAIYFPTFFDWSNDKAPITQHQEYFKSWIEQYGTQFELG